MKSFRDNQGRVWVIDVTVGVIKRVRALCDVDLASIIKIEKNQPNVELLTRLANDPVLLVDVLYAVCKEEADKLKISDEDFGRAMAGDAIEYACNALLDDVIEFFPEVKKKAFSKVLNATRRFTAKTNQQLTEILENPTFEMKVAEVLESSTNISDDVPESSE